MNRVIFSHNDDFVYPDDSMPMWNKHTIQSEEFVSHIKRNECRQQEDEIKAVLLNPASRLDCDYKFFMLNHLYKFQDYSSRNFQTVGLMKHEDEGFNLYPLVNESGFSLKLKFNTHINLCKCVADKIYARIYGFCVCYSSKDKVMMEQPDDLNGQPYYVEMWVNTWINLGSFEGARRLENILYKINYCKDNT